MFRRGAEGLGEAEVLCREIGGLGESEADVESTAVLSLRGGLLAHLKSRELYEGGEEVPLRISRYKQGCGSI